MVTIENNLGLDVMEKAKASINVSGIVNVTTIDTEVLKDDIDIDSFFGNISKEESSMIRPEDVERKEQEVILALKECDDLIIEANAFQQNFIVRGNQELYRLLSEIYAFALKVRMSEYRHHINEAMILALKDREIRIQENTSEMMVIIKYIVGQDRKRAGNYCRVLEIAIKENLAAKDLSEYIARRGGISQIYSTELENDAKAQGSKIQEKRLSMFREMLICRAWESDFEITYPNEPHLHSDVDDCKRSDFIFFMARKDRLTGSYKILHAHKFGERFENQVIRLMTGVNKLSLSDLEKNLRRYREILIEKKVIPEVIANIWKRGLLKGPDSSKSAPVPNI